MYDLLAFLVHFQICLGFFFLVALYSDMLLGSFLRLIFPEFIVLESDERLIFFSLTLAEIQDTSSIYMQI